jgi:hypothetical protein
MALVFLLHPHYPPSLFGRHLGEKKVCNVKTSATTATTVAEPIGVLEIFTVSRCGNREADKHYRCWTCRRCRQTLYVPLDPARRHVEAEAIQRQHAACSPAPAVELGERQFWSDKYEAQVQYWYEYHMREGHPHDREGNSRRARELAAAKDLQALKGLSREDRNRVLIRFAENEGWRVVYVG